MRFLRGELISPAAAEAYFGTGTTRSSSFSGVSGFEGRPPEIVEQARALNNDPDQIFEYVSNHIEIEFAYGLRKGPLGTYIDKSGTAFDQNVLFVELIRQAGFEARYRIGRATLTQAQFTSWTGVSDLRSACRMLASGGMPAAFNGESASAADCNLSGGFNSVILSHVWSEVNIGGSWYVFDPSFKGQAVAPRRSLETESGLTTGAVSTAAASGNDNGATSGVAYIGLVDDLGVTALLEARAEQLLTNVAANVPAGDMRDVVGGKEIVQAYEPAGGFRSTTTPYTSSVVATVTGDIPDQYRTGFLVAATTGFGSISRQMYVDEIYGRRLEFDSNFDAEHIQTPGDYFDVAFRLELDDVTLNQVSNTCPTEQYSPGCVLPGFTWDGSVTLNHPYAAASGAFADAGFSMAGSGAVPVAIMHGYGRVSSELGTKWGRERDEDKSLPNRVASGYNCDPEYLCQPAFETPAGDLNRQRIGAAWMAQVSRMMDLQGEVGSSEIQHHHSVGTVQWTYGISTYDPQPDFPGPVDFGIQDQQLIMTVGTGVSVSSRVDDQVRARAVSRAIALASATLEGSVVEQMQDLPDGASTAARFAWANRPDNEDPCGGSRRRFYDFTGSSSTTRAGLIRFEDQTNGCETNPVMTQDDRTIMRLSFNNVLTAYLNAGFSISAPGEAFLGPGARFGSVSVPSACGFWGCSTPRYGPSLQRGGAFVANRFDTNGDPLEIAHIIVLYTGPAKGGGGSAPERSSTTFDPRRAADVLKDRFVDRSTALGVDLRTGAMTYRTPTLLSTGAGDGAPYRLDYGLSFNGAPDGCSPQFGPCSGPVQGGWNHDWDIRFSLSGSGLEAMGATSPLSGTDTIVAFMAMQDVFAQTGVDNLRKDVFAAIVADWWRQRMVGNVATINRGFSAAQYVRRSDDAWMPPIGAPGVLTQTGARARVRDICYSSVNGVLPMIATARRWDQANVTFGLRQATGETMSFQPWVETYTVDACAKIYGFRLTAMTWPQGPSLSFTGGTSSSIGSVTSSLGRTMQVGPFATTGGRAGGFNAQNAIVDSAGAAWTYGYTDPVARSATQRPRPFTQLYRVFEPVAPSLPALQYAYDSLGRVHQAWDATALQLGTRGPYEFFFGDGARGQRLDPAGGRYTVDYDTDADPVRRTDELGRLTTSTFDGRHRVTQRTYPEGDRDLFAYDARDNITALTRRAKPGSSLADIVIEAQWNALWNKPDWIENGRDLRTNFTYVPVGTNGASQVQTAVQPQIGTGTTTWSYAYDAIGLLTREAEPTGRATTHVNDSLGNRTSTTAATEPINGPALNLTTTFTPNAFGDIETTVNPRGNATAMQYDVMRRMVASQNYSGAVGGPLLALTDRTYDGLGRVTLERRASALDGSGQPSAWVTTLTSYTPTGQVRTQTDPDNRTTTTSYDAMDRTAGVIDAEGRVSAFAYDLAGQLLTERRAVGTPIEQVYATYAYTPNGQRDWLQDANANRTEFDYDGLDRLSRTTFPSPANGSPNPADYEELTYDPNGNILTRRMRSGATLTMTYDVLDRLSARAVPALNGTAARNGTFTYDKVGRRISALEDNGQLIGWTYDAAGREITTTVAGPQWPGVTRTVSTQYNLNGVRNRLTWPDGWYVQYVYDGLDRMTEARINGNTPAEVTFAYDPLSRPTSETRPGGTVGRAFTAAGDLLSLAQTWSGGSVTFNHGYEATHRLTSLTNTNAAFNPISGATGTTAYTPDRLNRYSAVGGTGLTYDAAGNLTSDGTRTYLYDAENQLVTATGPSLSAVYVYDPLGRRAGKAVNTGGPTTALLSAGGDEIAVYLPDGSLGLRWVPGPVIDQPVMQVSAAGVPSYFRQDRLGSTIAMTSATGALVEGPYAYDAYGRPNLTTGTPFKYAGRRYDAETGLYYNRARYYSPTLGRFLQTDPIQYDDGLNLYAYVDNDPANAFDPTGLQQYRSSARYRMQGTPNSWGQWSWAQTAPPSLQEVLRINPRYASPPSVGGDPNVLATAHRDATLRNYDVFGRGNLDGSRTSNLNDGNGVGSIQRALATLERVESTRSGDFQFQGTGGLGAAEAFYASVSGRSGTIGSNWSGEVAGARVNVNMHLSSGQGGGGQYRDSATVQINVTRSIPGSRILVSTTVKARFTE